MKKKVVQLAVFYDSKSPFTSQKKYNFERPVLRLPPFFFKKMLFSSFLRDFSTKIPLEPPNEIGNMPLRSDKLICFIDSKNIRNKIRDIQLHCVISGLHVVAETSPAG